MIYKAFDTDSAEWIYSDKVKTKTTAQNDDWYFDFTTKYFCITETHERFYEQNGQTETYKEYKELKGILLFAVEDK